MKFDPNQLTTSQLARGDETASLVRCQGRAPTALKNAGKRALNLPSGNLFGQSRKPRRNGA